MSDFGGDATGDDAAGDDATGDDATGDDATSDDAIGDDAIGDDTTGDDAIGENRGPLETATFEMASAASAASNCGAIAAVLILRRRLFGFFGF